MYFTIHSLAKVCNITTFAGRHINFSQPMVPVSTATQRGLYPGSQALNNSPRSRAMPSVSNFRPPAVT
jgi:hypothetical protein